MGKINTKDITNKSEWEGFVMKNYPKSFLHSWSWGEVQKGIGNNIRRLGYYNDSRLSGVSLFIEQHAKRGKHLIVPGGPIINWQDDGLVFEWIESLKKLSKEMGCWFVRVRPELVQTDENQKIFQDLGFVSAPMHLHSENTWVLDIKKNEEELLMGMRKNTRYMVRKAVESDLKVELSTDTTSVGILYELQKDTVLRHKFVGFTKKLFEKQIEEFGKNDQVGLYLVKKGGEVLVAAIIIFYGDYAYYHHSASSENSRLYPASYALQWQVIKDAKKRGHSYYNFWGIAPKGRENHRFSGVTTFKKGFGGERIDWLHAMDYPVSKKYYITNAFERSRKLKRNL